MVWWSLFLLLFSAQEQISPNHVQAIFSGSVHIQISETGFFKFSKNIEGNYCTWWHCFLLSELMSRSIFSIIKRYRIFLQGCMSLMPNLARNSWILPQCTMPANRLETRIAARHSMVHSAVSRPPVHVHRRAHLQVVVQCSTARQWALREVAWDTIYDINLLCNCTVLPWFCLNI